jgi:hypothetical protein
LAAAARFAFFDSMGSGFSTVNMAVTAAPRNGAARADARGRGDHGVGLVPEQAPGGSPACQGIVWREGCEGFSTRITLIDTNGEMGDGGGSRFWS